MSFFWEFCFCWANFGGKTSGREKAADGFTWTKVQCPKEDLNDGSDEGKSMQIGKSTLGKPYAFAGAFPSTLWLTVRKISWHVFFLKGPKISNFMESTVNQCDFLRGPSCNRIHVLIPFTHNLPNLGVFEIWLHLGKLDGWTSKKSEALEDCKYGDDGCAC